MKVIDFKKYAAWRIKKGCIVSMQIGISSACFYPMETLDSLKLLGEHGVKMSEIFMNSFSELKKEYVNELFAVKDYYGMQIPSIHPFTSEFEPFMFFTDYKSRVDDALDFYKQYFEAGERLGAKFLVFHGDKKGSKTSIETYAERYSRLYELGKSYSITVCQEDVPRCRCSNIEFILELKRLLGDNLAFVADFKQAIRSGMDVEEMIKAMGKNLCYVHASDSSKDCDCLAPSKGNADFEKLIGMLIKYTNVQDMMIELYSKNFSGIDEVVDSLGFLKEKAAIAESRAQIL